MATRDAMTTRPALAIKIAECIAEWAELENTLGLVLAMTLGTNNNTAVAMWGAVENRTSQLRMLEAAVGGNLPTHHAEVVQAIINGVVRPVMKERDRLAHWCWGYSQELPDDLLIIEPIKKMEMISQVVVTIFNLSRDHIYVVREDDLKRMLARFRDARSLAGRITGTLWKKIRPESGRHF